MAGEGESEKTLRDVITQAVDAEEVKQAPSEAPAPAAAEPAAAEPKADGRARDEQGRFVPKETAAQPETRPQPQDAKAQSQPAAAVPEVPRPQRPSSWKKDYWEHWDKLDPKLASYIKQREDEYAKGVSTYKAEWDRAKPLLDSLAPYQEVLQSRNIRPEQWVQNMAAAEHALINGSPEQKLSMFMKLAQDYQIPLQSLFTQGQDGKVYFNPNVQPYQPQAQPQQDVRRTVQEILQQEKAVQALAQFEQEAGTKYPHYEVLKADMARLLEAGFTETLESAYDTALRLPQHAELYAQAQQARAEADKAEAARKEQERVQRARAAAVSPRTSTPATKGQAQPRSVRETIEAAMDAHLQSDRV